MDVSDWLAIGAVVIAFLALIVSWRGHALAKKGADLQQQIDARGREYQEVTWGVGTDRPIGDDRVEMLRLSNHGVTAAENVTVVIRYDHDSEKLELGAIPSGKAKAVPSARLRAWMDEKREYMPLAPAVTVHWTSPLGNAQQVYFPPTTLFELPED